MTEETLKAQIFALPIGPNGLPDILLLESDRFNDQAIVRAFIVPSARGVKGYWSERFNAEGADAMKWARLFAKERVREHVMAQHSPTEPIDQRPFELVPFVDWDALSVQRFLGFYPSLRTAAQNSNGVEFLNLLREKDTAYPVEITSQHFPPSSTMVVGQ